jgi:hypothetical protein
VEAKYRRIEPIAPSVNQHQSSAALNPPSSKTRAENFDAAAALEALEAENKEDRDALADVTEVTEETVRRMLLHLEKRSLRNQEMRMKHADQPQQFLQSEADLYDTLQELQVSRFSLL